MAGRYDVVILQGESFRREIAWRDAAGVLVDLSTYTARMTVRSAAGVSQISLTTGNSRITLSSGAGTYNVLLTISPSDTAALTEWGKGRYDLELVSAGGTVTRALEGYALLSEEQTT